MFNTRRDGPSHILHSRIQNIVFDLGDVLFKWSSASPASPLPPKTLKNILRSAVWYEYEKGRYTENEAYSKVAEQFNIAAEDVASAFAVARDSLQSDPNLLDIIRELKASGRAIFAMSNISTPDWHVLKTKADPSEWALFDRVFTSEAAGERKPNVGFYRHVIKESGIDPTRTIFIDDKIENVLTARSFGMHGIVFEDREDVIRQLRNLCDDPVARAWSFLLDHKKQLNSFTSSGVALRENFAQLLILEATGDSSLVDYVDHDTTFNFFQGCGVLTTEAFPNDLDTTSIGLSVISHADPRTKNEVMDQMLLFRNHDGLIQVYFDHSRPRIDPIVCVNVLTLFYRNGRGKELGPTLDWVEKVLLHRAYIGGTLYYVTAESFLFFLSRLVQSSPQVRQRLESVLRDRLSERFGADGDALALAMRIIAAARIGIVDKTDFVRLLSMQESDGSWRNGWFYKYGSSGLLIGNDGVTTALAIQAIEAVGRLESRNGVGNRRTT